VRSLKLSTVASVRLTQRGHRSSEYVPKDGNATLFTYWFQQYSSVVMSTDANGCLARLGNRCAYAHTPGVLDSVSVLRPCTCFLNSRTLFIVTG
jgi:hypothetical protein